VNVWLRIWTAWKKLAFKYGVYGENTLLSRVSGRTKELLRFKMDIVKHTVEELAYFLVKLGMEITAHNAMVKELREAPLGSHKDLRSCGEYHWQLQKRRMATRVSEPSHL
jgi:hypothetical protein